MNENAVSVLQTANIQMPPPLCWLASLLTWLYRSPSPALKLYWELSPFTSFFRFKINTISTEGKGMNNSHSYHLLSSIPVPGIYLLSTILWASYYSRKRYSNTDKSLPLWSSNFIFQVFLHELPHNYLTRLVIIIHNLQMRKWR